LALDDGDDANPDDDRPALRAQPLPVAASRSASLECAPGKTPRGVKNRT
jgi:hypothetical protein